jgi:3-oxocholest-4-en-26-oyl-CoA dehydrogenase alpha subunit
VDFELSPEQQSWRDEVRAFLSGNVTPELREELARMEAIGEGPLLREFRGKVGAKGWYALNWPPEYGGLGKSAVERHLLSYEFDYAGVPAPDLTVTSIAPMIMSHGTAENKADFLPGIASGDITVVVGYSEPNAGTDLASLTTRAELDGDEWVINGSKIWNTRAHMATHEWLCARTDPTASRHRGISVIMVPVDTPGIEVRPLYTWRDLRTNETFFTDVRVPRRNLIGQVNTGWQYITGALDLERGALTNAGDLRRAVDELIAFCRDQPLGGRLLIDESTVRRRLAELDADVEVARLYGLEAASLIDTGVIPTLTVTAEKIFTSELRQKIADYGTQILGAYGQLDGQDPLAPAGGAMERLYRRAPLLRFGGGTNEVLRDVIAQRGYGMPDYGRTRRTPDGAGSGRREAGSR